MSKKPGRLNMQKVAPVPNLARENEALRQQVAALQGENAQLKQLFKDAARKVKDAARKTEERYDEYRHMMHDLELSISPINRILAHIDVYAIAADGQALRVALGQHARILADAYQELARKTSHYGQDHILAEYRPICEAFSTLISEYLAGREESLQELQALIHDHDQSTVIIYELAQRERQRAREEAAEQARQQVEQGRIEALRREYHIDDKMMKALCDLPDIKLSDYIVAMPYRSTEQVILDEDEAFWQAQVESDLADDADAALLDGDEE